MSEAAAAEDYSPKERWLVELADDLRAARGKGAPTSRQKVSRARLAKALRALNVLETVLQCLEVDDVPLIWESIEAIRELIEAEAHRLGD